jgi:hypothetical protein
MVNSFSMLSPGSWSLTTPNELKVWGWTTVDLWSAPAITALYAMLTQIQPFWFQLSAMVATFAGLTAEDEKSTPTLGVMDMESARSVCILVLCSLFSARAVYNFGAPTWAKYKSLGQSCHLRMPPYYPLTIICLSNLDREEEKVKKTQ